jgi:Polysaccharide lyase
VGPVEIYDGDEYAYSFSFYVQPAAYRAPGEDNLILRFADEAGEDPSLGLQLWDDGSGDQRGVWASGEAMGDERFLAPVVEGVWHQMALYFKASNDGDGLYLLLLDGEPIDARAWVSLIDAGSDRGILEAGLFRDGERVDGAPEIFFGPARLSETLESVIP